VNNTQQEQAIVQNISLCSFILALSLTQSQMLQPAAALVIKSKNLLEANAENGIEIDLRQIPYYLNLLYNDSGV